MTTADFVDFSPPRLFFDPGYNIIDASVARCGDRYLMAFKDERGENRHGTDYKALRVCFADAGGGPFGDVSDLISPPLVEGPTLFHNGQEWVILYDQFVDLCYGALTSPDGLHWTDATDRLTMPNVARHGTVLPIPDDLGQRLRAATGG